MLKLLKIRHKDGSINVEAINEIEVLSVDTHGNMLRIVVRGLLSPVCHNCKEGYKADLATFVKQFNASNIVDLDMCEYKEIVKRS